MATRARVGVGRLPDPGLACVLELATLRDRHEVQPRLGEAHRVGDRVLDPAPAPDDLVAEQPAPDGPVGPDLAADGVDHLERQALATREVPAVPVLARVPPREEARQRVGVGHVQLEPIEAGLARPARRGGEERGQLGREPGHVGEVHVGHPLARAHVQVLQLARGQHLLELGTLEPQERGAQGRLVAVRQLGPERGEASPVAFVQLQEPAEVGGRLGPPPDPQEVQHLDDQPRPPAAALPHRLHQLAESGEEAVVPDPEQGPRGHVAHARGLHHQDAGPALREAPVPLEHLRGHEALLGGAPGDHRGHPPPGPALERADPERGEQLAPSRLGGGRPARGGQVRPHRTRMVGATGAR